MYKPFLRILLIISLVVYITGFGFWQQAQAQTENGIGGGVAPEELELLIWENFEFDEVYEPACFPRPRMLTFSSHVMERGDIIGHIAQRTGLNEDTLISVNNVTNSRLMQIGQVLRIPNQDGILYTVRAGDTLESIAARYDTTVDHIVAANELFSHVISPNDVLFIPGGRMDWVRRQEINGDLFIWPAAGRISSSFGFRVSPFSRVRHFHGGIDISAPTGTPVRAAMGGRVIQVGYDNTWGHFVLISHHSGFRTFYAHMNVVRVRPGAQVATGQRIGDVGSTGLSTGPHLHFEVHRNGVRVNPLTLMR